MGCPDEHTLARFASGELPEVEIAKLEAHLDSCAACRRAVVALARLATQRAHASIAASRGALGDPEHAPTIPAEAVGGEQLVTPAPRRPRVNIGDSIDHFQILQPLGAGGMGEVYLALDTQLNRQVALKLLRPALLQSSGFAQLVDEARATARFNHPNIVTIHHVGLDSARPYLAFEYLPGETLRQRMLRGKLSRRELVEHLRAIAAALCEAHENGLSHRDLKPENIMLPLEGPLRVLDFGLALEGPELPSGRLSSLPEGATSETSHHPDLCGTPAYMAPEQWRGVAGPASDVWAFGVLLYELICGQRPFLSRELEALRDEISAPGDAPSPPCELPFAALAGLAEDCLQRDLAARPSAAQLVERLAAVEAEVRRGRPQPFSGWAGNLLVLFGVLCGYFAVGATVSVGFIHNTVTEYFTMGLLGLLPAGLAGVMLYFGLRRGRGTIFHFIIAGLALLIGVLYCLGVLVSSQSGDKEGLWFSTASALYWFAAGATLLATGAHNIKRRRDDEAYARA